jgi:hypothetical protein
MWIAHRAHARARCLRTYLRVGRKSKSRCFASVIGPQQFVRNPDLKTIYASYSEDLGVMRNLNLQRLFTSQRYNEIFPELLVGDTRSRGLRTSWQLNSNLIEYVERTGSFRNTTVRGQITGMEQHLGVIDDFVKGRAEATSKVERDKTWNWFSDDFMTRMNKDSALLIVATRWHIL